MLNRSDTDAGDRESGYVKTSHIDNENHIVFGDTIGDTNNPIRIVRNEFLDVSTFLTTHRLPKNIAKRGWKASVAPDIN